MAHHPENCGSYLFCIHGEEKVHKCPEGLHYNREQKICDWPANAKCNTPEPVQETDTTGATTDYPPTTTTEGPPPSHGTTKIKAYF